MAAVANHSGDRGVLLPDAMPCGTLKAQLQPAMAHDDCEALPLSTSFPP